MKNKIKMRVTISIEKDENEFHAFCPTLKGMHTCGKTEKEAIKNAKDAIAGYIVSLIKHNEPIPCCEIVEKTSRFKTMDKIEENIPIPIAAFA